MKETKVAVRYAKSVLSLAIGQNKLDRINEDMASIAQTVNGSQDLKKMLQSPLIKSDKKINILKALFGNTVDELTMSFMVLMTEKKREQLLPEIAEEFSNLFREEKSIIKAEVTSAQRLDDNIKSQIRAKIGAKGEIEFIEKIDPALIGGFIVRIGDKQFDGSIARSISELKKNFLKNDYITSF